MRQLPPDRSQTSVLHTRKFMKPPLFPGEKTDQSAAVGGHTPVDRIAVMRQLPPDRSQTSVLHTRKFMKPPLFPGEKRQRRFSAVWGPEEDSSKGAECPEMLQ